MTEATSSVDGQAADVVSEQLIVLPGGSGYLGGRIAQSLLGAGHRLRVVSRTVRDGPDANPRRSGHALDWRQPEAIDSVLKGADAVVLLAAANEIDAARDPVAANEATSSQCLAWLQAAVRCKVRRFVYLSTIHVYGPDASKVLREDSPLRPVHPYATTHAAAELFVAAAHRRGDIDATILRLSNAFGAPADAQVDRWSLLLNDLARQAVIDGRLRLKTPGLQARDFIGIDVVAQAVAWALRQAMNAAPEAAIYNLGSGRSATVLEMTERLQQRCLDVLGFKPPIERPPAPVGAQSERFALDVTRLRSAGFLAETDVDAEIDALLRFCAEHRDHLLR